MHGMSSCVYGGHPLSLLCKGERFSFSGLSLFGLVVTFGEGERRQSSIDFSGNSVARLGNVELSKAPEIRESYPLELRAPLPSRKDADDVPKSLVKVRTQETGRRLVWGNDEMKSSQAYPPAFGQAVEQVWSSRRIELLTEAAETLERFRHDLSVVDANDLFGTLPAPEQWQDAELDAVFRVLQS